MQRLSASLLLLLVSAAPAPAQPAEWWPGSSYDARIPTPKSVLGYEIGEYWTEHEAMTDYMRRLENASQRVKVFSLGRTNEKRELLLVRRALWPMREVLSRMQRDPHECFSDVTRTYMRDVYDHAVQAIDIVETYREVAGGLTETYLTAISIRMNEVMKVLTVIGTIFIPLTFFAGVYGMNFKHLPEFEWRYGYGLFWAIRVGTAATMLVWFRRKGWL